MSIFKKKEKNETLPSTLKDSSVEYKTKNKKEEKKIEKKKQAKKEKRSRIGHFFKSVFAETKKVTWPSWKKTLSQTGIVIFVVLVFTIIILIFDLIFSQLLSLITTGKGANPIQG